MTDTGERDIALVGNARAKVEARIEAARRLAASDERAAWNRLFDLAHDHDLPVALSLEVGTSLAHMAHRIRQGGHWIRDEDENFLLRDFSESAFEGYDSTAAELERERNTGR